MKKSVLDCLGFACASKDKGVVAPAVGNTQAKGASMADPAVTDVFKFVAVRPPEPVAETMGGPYLVHDPRAKTAAGKAELTLLMQGVTRSEEALARYRKLDIARLELVADSYRRLAHIFITGPHTGKSPEPKAALETAGLSADGDHRDLADLAWNALYLGYRAEPASAPLLDAPTAALRVLHFIEHVTGDSPSKLRPDDLLEARPVLPVEVAQFTEPQPLERPARGPAEDAPGHNAAEGPELERMQALIDGVDMAHRLLEAMRSAPRRTRVKVKPHASLSTEADGDDAAKANRSFVALSTVATVREALPEPSGHERALLTRLGIEEAPIPAATQALEAHATTLTQEAYRLRDDRRFLDLVKQSASRLNVLFPIPFIPFPEKTNPSTAGDVDVRGRIRPLGVGDLKVVKQKLLAYVPGEVAHIENVLKGESKERIFRTLDRTETTVFTAEETSEEETRDTQTTDRFELKKEAEQTIKEDMSVKAGLTVTAELGVVKSTAQGEFAYSTSKQDSMKSSANFARDVVDRSVSKVQKRVTTERTTKTLRETEETDTHGIDNKKGPGHITGVYRWVDKKYRAQVYNYGRRLMLEFIVPEPAAFFRASQLPGAASKEIDAKPPVPFLDLKGKELTASDIDTHSYAILASRYNAAGVTPPPPLWTDVATTFEDKEIPNGHTFSKSVKDLAIPPGYVLSGYHLVGAYIWQYHPHFNVQVGANKHYIEANPKVRWTTQFDVGIVDDPLDEPDNPRGILPISAMGYDVQAYTVNVRVICVREQATYEQWQLQTFDKIYTAYKGLQAEYDQKVAQAQAQAAGIEIAGRNPALNREIEKKELKKLCIEMMTGQHFNSFDAMTDPADPPTHLPEVDVYEALEEGPIVQFFEQAFDWEQLTYLYYPYFWNRKTKWVANSNESDPDPMFGEFLQSGAARVVVPASRAYNDAVLYFLWSDKPNLGERLWKGGPTPTVSDPLYRSIAEEVRNQTDDLAGAKPEGEPWEFTLPTTLVWLQENSKLPVFE